MNDNLIEELTAHSINSKSFTIRRICGQAAARMAELEGLLNVAKCPCCNGDGAYYDSMGDVCQCQWCYEKNELIPPETGNEE